MRTADPHTGKELFWPFPIVPWHLNPDWPGASASCQATASGDPAFDAVRASFAQWEQTCTDLKLLYAGPLSELRTGGGGDEQNLVVFRHGWCSQDPAASQDPCMTDPDVDCGGIYGCFEDSAACTGQTSCSDWAVVALTSVLYDPTTGRIMDADIELNGWDGVLAGVITNPPQHGWYFTCFPGTPPPTICTDYGQPAAGQPACGYMDLQNTLTHEIGHLIGLAHSPVPGATMNATTQPGEIQKRDLAQDDIDAVCSVYPVSSGGCGCGGGSAGAASLLAIVALRPLRRGRQAR